MDPLIARAKLAQAKEALRNSEFDCWLLLSREGSDGAVPFLTGGRSVGMAAFLIHRDGSDEALVANFDVGHVAALGVMESVRPYERGLREPLIALLQERGVRRIALDYSPDDPLADGLTHGMFLWFTEGGPVPWTIGSAAQLLAAVRGVKVPAEVDRLRRACAVTDEIYGAVRAQLRVGMSEREISGLFSGELAVRGLVSGTADAFEGAMVLLPRMGMSHRNPTDARVMPGDMLIVDFSVVMDGYASDIARTFYAVGPGESEAPPEVLRMFSASRRAIVAAAEALRPGRRGYEIDGVAREVLRAAGYPDQPIHAVGHQIGQSVHDGGTLLAPRWERYGRAPEGEVMAGMVFAIEPTILPAGPCAVLTEENVLVGETGYERLGEWQSDIWLIRD